jgi:hypothetical protein
MSAGDGTLAMVVWPSYVGVSCGAPNDGMHWEPASSTDYERGQIQWGMENGEIVGRALIHVPAGVEFTHFVYFTHPTDPVSIGNRQMPYPYRPETAGVLEVYPITNPDLALNKRQGIDY